MSVYRQKCGKKVQKMELSAVFFLSSVCHLWEACSPLAASAAVEAVEAAEAGNSDGIADNSASVSVGLEAAIDRDYAD